MRVCRRPARPACELPPGESPVLTQSRVPHFRGPCRTHAQRRQRAPARARGHAPPRNRSHSSAHANRGSQLLKVKSFRGIHVLQRLTTYFASFIKSPTREIQLDETQLTAVTTHGQRSSPGVPRTGSAVLPSTRPRGPCLASPPVLTASPITVSFKEKSFLGTQLSS